MAAIKPFSTALGFADQIANELETTFPAAVTTARATIFNETRLTRHALGAVARPTQSPVGIAMQAVTEGRADNLIDDPEFTRALILQAVRGINYDDQLDAIEESRYSELFLNEFDTIIDTFNKALKKTTATIAASVDEFGDDPTVFTDGTHLAGRNPEYINRWSAAAAANIIWDRTARNVCVLYRANPATTYQLDTTPRLAYLNPADTPDFTDHTPWSAIAAGHTPTLARVNELARRRSALVKTTNLR